MRILFFTDHFKPEPSAPAAHVYERARLWSEWGHEVTVITSTPNFPEGKVYEGYKNHWRLIEYIDGIRVVRVKTFIAANKGFVLRILDYLSYMISAFVFSFAEKKPDVIISTSPHLFVPVAGLLSGLLRRVPHVFELRDLWPASILGTTDLMPRLAYRLIEAGELTLYHLSSRILSFTHSYVKNLTQRGIPAFKIDVVLNGANLDLFTPRPKDQNLINRYSLRNKIVVGYMGTIGLAHGLENIVKAAEQLRDKLITFLFVGVGATKKELEQTVRCLKLTNVLFAGRQPREEMPRFWSICDISLIHLKNAPVFSTVIPSKIFESMAMGLPIIYVGPPGEGMEIIIKHQAGLVVKAANPTALADAVLALTKNIKLRHILAKNSLKAASKYSREYQAKESLAVLEKALHKGKHK